MHHVTKYCNMIGVHCTVCQDKACIHSSQTLPSLAEVGLACETRSFPAEAFQFSSNQKLEPGLEKDATYYASEHISSFIH